MRNGLLICLCMSVNVLISTALNGFKFLLQPKANQRAERMPFHPRRIFDYSEDAFIKRHFRVAFYCGQPKAHLCNNRAV